MSLLMEIARCKHVENCLNNTQHQNKCNKIIQDQKKELDQFQVPEPWNGNLKTAPILFLGSNPSISTSDKPDYREKYPRWSWSDSEIEDFFSNRFGGGKEPWIKDGIYTLLESGDHKKTYVRYFAAIRKRAKEILGRPVEPGSDYVNAEIIHCKSKHEFGVREASETCIELYLRRIIAESGAKVIVCLGGFAERAVRKEFGIFGTSEPISIREIERLFVFLPHPNARKSRKFSLTDIERIREFLEIGPNQILGLKRGELE